MSDHKKTLFILPNFLGTKHPDAWMPQFYHHSVTKITGIFCESYKSAELLISRTSLPDDVKLMEINEHSNWDNITGEVNTFFNHHQQIAVLSDAGLPAVADPGAKIVALAHKKGYEISILPGSNSMVYALACSGFNGQKFAFKGYIAIDKKNRIDEINAMVRRLQTEKESQIFMETPYRNVALLEELIEICPPNLGLCIACNMLEKDSWIKSMTMKEWKIFYKENDINTFIKKKPAVFVLGLS